MVTGCFSWLCAAGHFVVYENKITVVIRSLNQEVDLVFTELTDWPYFKRCLGQLHLAWCHAACRRWLYWMDLFIWILLLFCQWIFSVHGTSVHFDRSIVKPVPKSSSLLTCLFYLYITRLMFPRISSLVTDVCFKRCVNKVQWLDHNSRYKSMFTRLSQFITMPLMIVYILMSL